MVVVFVLLGEWFGFGKREDEAPAETQPATPASKDDAP